MGHDKRKNRQQQGIEDRRVGLDPGWVFTPESVFDLVRVYHLGSASFPESAFFPGWELDLHEPLLSSKKEVLKKLDRQEERPRQCNGI